MKLTYDPKHNIAYMRFGTKQKEVQTLHISDTLNIDIAPDGTLYGIELMNANEQLRRDQDSILFMNESTGQTVEVPLS